jgi:hypothetical protein
MSSVVAVLCLAFTVFIGCSIAGQMADARRIDASPARVKGTVDRIIPGSRGSGSVVRVSYQAAGRRPPADHHKSAPGTGRTSMARGR